MINREKSDIPKSGPRLRMWHVYKLNCWLSGHVSFQEFKTWYVGSEYRIEKEIKDIFEKYDKTGDGTISHTEIRDLLIEAGVGEEEVMMQNWFKNYL